MKRVFYLFSIFCLIFISACSSEPKEDKMAAAKTAAFDGAVKSLVETQQASQNQAPTAVPPAPVDQAPAANPEPAVNPDQAANPAAPAVQQPAASAPTGPVLMDEHFDQLSEDWQTLWVSNYVENATKSEVRLDDGWLLFDMKDRSAPNIYMVNTKVNEADVVISATNVIAGPGRTEVALACRINGDQSSWIDFRILYLNEYAIYKYDRSMLDRGENPFVQLTRAHIPQDLLKGGQENIIQATCKGKTATLDLNGQNLGSVDVDDSLMAAGNIGFGGIGPGDKDVASIWFDNIKVSKP